MGWLTGRRRTAETGSGHAGTSGGPMSRTGSLMCSSAACWEEHLVVRRLHWLNVDWSQSPHQIAIHTTPLHYWGFTSHKTPPPPVFMLINDFSWILTSKCDAGLSTFSPLGATIQVGFQSGIILSWKGFLPGRTGSPAGLWPRGLGLDTPSQSLQSATDQPFNLTLYISNHICGFPNRVKARRYVAIGMNGEVCNAEVWKCCCH